MSLSPSNAMLVSIAEASTHIRRDPSANDDADLTLKIMAASRAIVNYMQSGADMFLTSSGEADIDSDGVVIDVPADVKLATLYLVGEYYKNREGAMDTPMPDQQAYGYGNLPLPVTSLLYWYRDPTAC